MNMKKHFIGSMLRVSVGMMVAVTVAAGTAWAGEDPGMPYFIYTPDSICNQYGMPLPGTVEAPGCRVQFLVGTTNYPPAIDGTADARNSLLNETGIGALTCQSAADAGLFAYAITETEKTYFRTSFFVRVFNSATPASATYYGDSPIMSTVSTVELYAVTLSATRSPLDGGDSDSDGLVNTVEAITGTDSGLADSDGDGISDYDEDSDGDGMGNGDEVRASTNPGDPNNVLAINDGAPIELRDVTLVWSAVRGLSYIIQYTEDDLKNSPAFTDVAGPVVATNDMMSVTIPDGLPAGNGHYRVMLSD